PVLPRIHFLRDNVGFLAHSPRKQRSVLEHRRPNLTEVIPGKYRPRRCLNPVPKRSLRRQKIPRPAHSFQSSHNLSSLNGHRLQPRALARSRYARPQQAWNPLHPSTRRDNPTGMEYRLLGGSGLKVSALSFGAATFGGGNEFFKAWGSTDVAEATRLIDVCLEAGVNLFDTADGYSNGSSEEILGKALAGKRDRVLISTKAYFPMGEGPNDRGTSRHHLRQALEASLRRLGTD